MRKIYAGKSKSGVEEVTEVGQIPLVLIQAQTSLSDAANAEFTGAQRLEGLGRAHALIESILKFIAKGECDLAAVTLTSAQRTLIHYALDDAEWAKEQCGRIGAEAAIE